MGMRNRANFVRAWAALSLAGCGLATFVVQQYDGPPRPRESIAIIRINAGQGIDSLDGETLRAVPAKGTRFHVEVLPGAHEGELREPAVGLTESVNVRFSAEAGKVYRIAVQGGVNGNVAARAFEVDRN